LEQQLFSEVVVLGFGIYDSFQLKEVYLLAILFRFFVASALRNFHVESSQLQLRPRRFGVGWRCLIDVGVESTWYHATKRGRP